MSARRIPFLVLFLSLASTASAAPSQIETQPPHPLAGTPVTVVVDYLCPKLAFSKVNGHVIELTTVSAVCLSASIPGQQFFPVGALQAGIYEVRIVDQGNYLLGTFEVAAAAAEVPALDTRGMWLLAAAILALGVFGIGRAAS